MSEIPTLHSKAEYLKAVMYEGVTILEGTATWCQQCKVIAPEVAKMVGEYPNVRPRLPKHSIPYYSSPMLSSLDSLRPLTPNPRSSSTRTMLRSAMI
jgi:thiol-disulfide isomerase/thioredoxin